NGRRCGIIRLPVPDWSQHALVLEPDGAVVFAGSRLDAWHVEDGEALALVTDPTIPPEPTDDRGDAGRRHPQHVGEELCEQLELVGPETVAHVEQPTGQTRLHRVRAVAGGLSPGDSQEQPRVTQQHLVQRLLRLSVLAEGS